MHTSRGTAAGPGGQDRVVDADSVVCKATAPARGHWQEVVIIRPKRRQESRQRQKDLRRSTRKQARSIRRVTQRHYVRFERSDRRRVVVKRPPPCGLGK